jgi:hypothetical protein
VPARLHVLSGRCYLLYTCCGVRVFGDKPTERLGSFVRQWFACFPTTRSLAGLLLLVASAAPQDCRHNCSFGSEASLCISDWLGEAAAPTPHCQACLPLHHVADGEAAAALQLQVAGSCPHAAACSLLHLLSSKALGNCTPC